MVTSVAAVGEARRRQRQAANWLKGFNNLAQTAYEQENDGRYTFAEYLERDEWDFSYHHAYQALGLIAYYQSDTQLLQDWDQKLEDDKADLESVRRLSLWAVLTSSVGWVLCGVGLVVGPILASIAVLKTMRMGRSPWQVAPRAIVTLVVSATLIALVIAQLVAYFTNPATTSGSDSFAFGYVAFFLWGAWGVASAFFGWLEGGPE